MSTILASFTNQGVPATGLSATIRIRRTDTQVLVVTDAAMTEQGDGGYSYDFTPVDGLDYHIRCDGTATLPNPERYLFAGLSGAVEARIETDIVDILADTAAMQPLVDVAVSTRSSHSAADVDTVLTASHGAGSWQSASAQDWTAGERENIRDALGIDGTKTAATGGQLQDVLADTAAIEPLATANLDATVSSRSSHTPANVDTTLSGTHGSGSWEGATAAAIVTALLSATLTADEGTSGSVAQALATLVNRLEVNLSTQKLELYDAAGTSVIQSWDLDTDVGEDVSTQSGVQTKRAGRDL